MIESVRKGIRTEQSRKCQVGVGLRVQQCSKQDDGRSISDNILDGHNDEKKDPPFVSSPEKKSLRAVC